MALVRHKVSKQARFVDKIWDWVSKFALNKLLANLPEKSQFKLDKNAL
jgi:hypothetical protein